MIFQIGDDVVITGDRLNYGLPLNAHAVVTRYERNPFDIHNYLIRVPQKRMFYWVCDQDIELADVVNIRQANEALREQMINVALDKKDKTLFLSATQNGGAQ